MRRVAALTAAMTLSGCTAHQITDRSDFIAEGTRTYAGESRERVIQAARVVLKQSDPTDFEFRDTLTGFTGLRSYVIFAVVTASRGRESWEFQTEPDGKAIRAAISISEAGVRSSGTALKDYENRMASVPLYRLFWDRVDYVLGRRPDWVSCEQADALVRASGGGARVLGGLCGPTSDGRDAPPPEPLPRLAATRRGGA